MSQQLRIERADGVRTLVLDRPDKRNALDLALLEALLAEFADEPAPADRVLLLGDPLPAARMYALGCIARVAAPDALEDAVEAVVGRLIQNAPLALRAMKATLVRQMDFRDGIPHDDIDALVARVYSSDDLREGIRARLERRPPRFTG